MTGIRTGEVDTFAYTAPPAARPRTVVSVRARLRRGMAMLVYSTGYPMLALALWIGAEDGKWERASLLVALGVIMSFIGWALLSINREGSADRTSPSHKRGETVTSVFLVLYNRAGALVVLLGSYAVAAMSHGWPIPQSFMGRFLLVSIPLFVLFAIPVENATPRKDPERYV
jgi:ABC-type Na+ efflux pump permease subunit